MVVGFHVIAEFQGCPKRLLEKVEPIIHVLNRIVEKSKLKKVGEASHQFSPYGATAVILLSSSHICVHTWPELGLLELDIFSCEGQEKAEKAFDECIHAFKPKKVLRREIK